MIWWISWSRGFSTAWVFPRTCCPAGASITWCRMTDGVRLLLCALALLSLGGCATVRTLDAAKPGAPVVYAGTRLDWYTINGGCCPLDRFGAEAPRYPGLDLDRKSTRLNSS